MCFLCCSLCTVAYAKNKKSSELIELQVLIDVSGSMKKNDPKNLRIPAIKLLINLLPKGTKVGIWLFAENTTQLVKTGIVNNRWKKTALLKINRIHSRGLFTDIEAGIHQASDDWFKSNEKNNRHLILLTDGMVDISKDIMQSAESRARVMTEQILQLQQAGVKVQTIALSNEVDIELLNKLALDTGGWFETALSADQLQKAFFKLFKQAVPQDTVPLEGNSFTIDKSIKEFSVLIFKEPGSAEAQLITPRGKKLISKRKSRNISWVSEKNYDLVTVKNPRAGVWKIIAKVDPENQVMIVTDLKFEIDEIPNHILINEDVNVNGYFTNHQQLVSKQRFLDLMDISVKLEGGQKWKMSAVSGKQGLFSKTLGTELKKGRHTLKIVADGKTFKREISKTIEVIESLIAVEKQVDRAARRVVIKLIPNRLAINTEMISIEASISQLGKQTIIEMIEKKEGQWKLLVSQPKLGHKMVNFSIIANTPEGQSITPTILPIIIDRRLFAAPKPKVSVIKKDEKKLDATKIEKTSEEEKGEDLDDEELPELEPVNWLKTSIIVVIINILLIAAGFFGYKFIKKQAVDSQEALLSRLD